MGEHGLMYKNLLYESAHHVPLIVRLPDRVPTGQRCDRLVAMVDFQQTILGLLGATPSGREQGRDAGPPLSGQGPDWQDKVLIHDSASPRAGIFTKDYQLAYVDGGGAILFDRINDPRQICNRFADPALQPLVRGLTCRIVQHHRTVGSPALCWVADLCR